MQQNQYSQASRAALRWPVECGSWESSRAVILICCMGGFTTSI